MQIVNCKIKKFANSKIKMESIKSYAIVIAIKCLKDALWGSTRSRTHRKHIF